MQPPEQPRPYLLFILILSIFALVALAVEVILPLDRETREILDYADFAVCILFFIDFLISLARAEDRLRYFFTWGWLDLLSSIPTVEPLRWGRAARVLRILRVLRAVRSARVVSSLILEKRAQSGMLAAMLFSILLVVCSSIIILHVEKEAESNIRSAEDALWWSVTTITTVGYGDRYPVTSEGRLVAVLLMIAGVGLFGTFSGFLASWFIQGVQTEQPQDSTTEMEALRKELIELRRLFSREGY
jgi:voltage-gated potassium channel